MGKDFQQWAVVTYTESTRDCSLLMTISSENKNYELRKRVRKARFYLGWNMTRASNLTRARTRTCATRKLYLMYN